MIKTIVHLILQEFGIFHQNVLDDSFTSQL